MKLGNDWVDHCDDYAFRLEKVGDDCAFARLVLCKGDREVHYHYVRGDNLLELRDVIDAILFPATTNLPNRVREEGELGSGD